jgi:WS/DGAT/MGAT family acyltransferase
MSRATYTRLSGLDHAFLHFETKSTYMHVALTGVFAGGSLVRGDGSLDFVRIRDHIASRLHLLPRYRQRLHYIPLSNDPVWVDDDRFDLEDHLRRGYVPRPGSDAQLKSLCARILERPLDRNRPLWEIWFIEGLSGGRFAMLSKVHHCMVDGIAGMELLAALLAPEATTEIEAPRPWMPLPPPSGAELLRDEMRRRARASLELAGRVPALVQGGDGGGLGSRLSSLWGFVRAGVTNAVATPFNQRIGGHRRVDWASFKLSDVKHVKQHLGGTLNDVVLTVVSGAVRRLLAERDVDVDGADFRALVPVSVRTASQRGETGNRVSAWIASLPVDEPDPLARHRKVCALTQSYRSGREERGAAVLTETAEWTTSLTLGMAIRLIGRMRAFNLLVTNVPGPRMPFYLLDAAMVGGHPHVPLFENQGLGIAILSYDTQLDICLVADFDLFPDLPRVTQWIWESFAELQRLAPAAEPPARRSSVALDGGLQTPSSRPRVMGQRPASGAARPSIAPPGVAQPIGRR